MKAILLAGGGLEGDTVCAASRAMDRYAAGDDDSFVELYDALAPQLLRSLLRRTRDRARAEDLLQRTFLQIHRHRVRFIQGTDPMPWAHAIARRLFIDEQRRQKRDPMDRSTAENDSATGEESPAESDYYARETARRLQATLESLPPNQRAAFELLRLDGHSHEQAAQALGTTVAAVKLRAHRAYRALHRALDERAQS